ncbi:MAG: Ig-like domain-containing protein [Gemmatimonadaceae bacterium]|nr:Ig-like domain-containing protein [Gemmatimonadaceae bacterium]
MFARKMKFGAVMAWLATAVACDKSTMPVETASVVVSPTSIEMIVGSLPQQLTATVTDAAGNLLTGRVVTWSSSAQTVASVSPTGLVTALARGGPVAIVATSGGKSGVATVMTQLPVASLAVAPATVVLDVGSTLQLNATLRDASGATLNDRPIAWTSSNPAIATVSSTGGLVTAVASGGPIAITASSGVASGSASVTVQKVIASMNISPASSLLEVGTTVQLIAELRDAEGNLLTRPTTWRSSSPAYATVTTTGLVTGVGIGGPVTVTASSGNRQATASVLVEPSVASVQVSPSSTSLEVGRTAQLVATLLDAAGNVLTNRPITWTSSNPAVVTVSNTGLVSGVAVGGPTTIRAASGLPSGAATVLVQPTVLSVTITPSLVTLAVDAVLQLAATVRDAAGNVLPGRTTFWTSSNPAVASVSPAGLVTGVRTGSATITANVAGVIGTAAIQVSPPTPPSVVKLLTGTWAGSTVISGTSIPVEYTLTETNGSVTGTNKWKVGTTVFSGPVNGSRSGSNVSMTSNFPGFDPFTFSGTLDGAVNRITGVINGSGFVNQSIAVNRISSSSAVASQRQVRALGNGSQAQFVSALRGKLR